MNPNPPYYFCEPGPVPSESIDDFLVVYSLVYLFGNLNED